MRCEAEKATERIKDNKTITDKEIWAMECLEREGCSVWQKFSMTLTTYRVQRRLKKEALENPTSQEEDKKAQGKRWYRKWL